MNMTFIGARGDSAGLVDHPKAVLLRGGLGPQHQDIDPAIGNAVGAQRPRDASGRVFGVPRPGPGTGSPISSATLRFVVRS
jgi:hypothetical protein